METDPKKPGASTLPPDPKTPELPVSGPGSCADQNFSLAAVLERKRREKDPYPACPGVSTLKASLEAGEPLEAVSGPETAPCAMCGQGQVPVSYRYCAPCQEQILQRSDDRLWYSEFGAWACVPAHFARANLNGHSALDEAQRRNMQELRAELEIIRGRRKTHHGGSIILGGAMGRGKTHLACAAVAWCRENRIAAAFVPTVKLLSHLRATYHPDSPTRETDVIDAIERVEFLALDDLGKEQDTEWAEVKFYEIISARVSHNRPTLVTMNISPRVLTEKSQRWAAIMDRLSQDAVIINFEGRSFRQPRSKASLIEEDELPF